jgi:hypothetical protein
LVFTSWPDTALTGNHIRQLHRDLLVQSEKNALHRGNHKAPSNDAVAIARNGTQLGGVFDMAAPFDTPRLKAEPLPWFVAAGASPCLILG